ncbi:biotin/lipoyl-binding protein [Archangium violaceum]|uniref:biotin/lipoyl-binding protein n=1 Tax=Archangium violaceum TaxID=83451 RepID=UPI001950B1CE|nr:biotin/lipoyl-binding protein [Archangium violaceum]
MDMPNALPIDVPQPARVAVWKRRPRGRWVILAGGLLYWRLHPRRLVAVQVVRGMAVEAVHANGTVAAKDRVDIRARAAGPLMRLLVREGDVVEKDQLLALIDTPTLERATRAPLLDGNGYPHPVPLPEGEGWVGDGWLASGLASFRDSVRQFDLLLPVTVEPAL